MIASFSGRARYPAWIGIEAGGLRPETARERSTCAFRMTREPGCDDRRPIPVRPGRPPQAGTQRGRWKLAQEGQQALEAARHHQQCWGRICRSSPTTVPLTPPVRRCSLLMMGIPAGLRSTAMGSLPGTGWTYRLPSLSSAPKSRGSNVGSAIKNFKKAMNDCEAEGKEPPAELLSVNVDVDFERPSPRSQPDGKLCT